MAKTFDELANKSMSKASRARAATKAKQMIGEVMLSEMRAASGLSQKALAERLGIKQPSLSKLEKQPDMQIGTLQKIVSALGGELKLVAEFKKGAVQITQFNDRARVPGIGPLTAAPSSTGRKHAHA